MGQDVSEKGGLHDRGRIVRRYLSALDARKPGRSTARTAESVAHRMHQIDTLLLSADPVQRLHLTQERIDLHAESLRLQGVAGGGDFDALEKAFVRVAKAYGDRHDVTYSAWRQVGVDAGVLTQAGIHQQAKPARAPKAPEAAATPDAATPEVATPEAATPEAATAPEPAAAKAPATKKRPAKKQPAAGHKSEASSGNGAAPKQVKKVAAKKAAEPKPQQQQLPAEAHLLS